jgi:hypothetical protein
VIGNSDGNHRFGLRPEPLRIEFPGQIAMLGPAPNRRKAHQHRAETFCFGDDFRFRQWSWRAQAHSFFE